MEKIDNEEEMSETFIAEVGQKSAIANENEMSKFSDIDVGIPDELEDDKIKTSKYKDSHNNKKPKKSNPLLIIILMILALIIGAFGSYYYFEVYNINESISNKNIEIDKDTNKDFIKEEINPDGLFVKELISNYDYDEISKGFGYNPLYAKEKVSIKDIDISYLSILAAKKANKSLGNTSFSNIDLKDSVKQLYGNQITIEDKDIEYDKGCTTLKYNNGYYNYTPSECGGLTMFSMKRKITKAAIDGDTLKVYVAVAILNKEEDKVYKGYNIDTKKGIDEVENTATTTFDIDKDYVNLNQYKYTFNYDLENNNYYLVSVELVK